MSRKKIGIEQFKPVKIQPDKTNNLCEDGIEKIPQSQTRKVDSSKPYYLEKNFKFVETMLSNQKQTCQHERLKKYSWLDIMMLLVTP